MKMCDKEDSNFGSYCFKSILSSGFPGDIWRAHGMLSRDVYFSSSGTIELGEQCYKIVQLLP